VENLKMLEEFLLKGNKVSEIEGIKGLWSLNALDLEDNAFINTHRDNRYYTREDLEEHIYKRDYN